jgi:hypothetical protein
MSDLKARFLAKIKVCGECHEWTGYLDIGGYGKLKHQGKWFRANRLAYELFNGPIPDGLFICHRCDNAACVNPKHLYAGTHEQNMRDAAERKRHFRGNKPDRRGELNPKAKLNSKSVRIIRERLSAGAKQKEIAAEYSISRGTVGGIKSGRIWRQS